MKLICMYTVITNTLSRKFDSKLSKSRKGGKTTTTITLFQVEHSQWPRGKEQANCSVFSTNKFSITETGIRTGSKRCLHPVSVCSGQSENAGAGDHSGLWPPLMDKNNDPRGCWWFAQGQRAYQWQSQEEDLPVSSHHMNSALSNTNSYSPIIPQNPQAGAGGGGEVGTHRQAGVAGAGGGVAVPGKET